MLNEINWTFLVTYYCQPEFLSVCLDSIKKYHPATQVIVSQQIGDMPFKSALRIEHDMKQHLWADAAIGLMARCNTTYAVLMEHDVFLTKGLTDLMYKIEKEEKDLIGVEDVVEGLRASPGFAMQNFMLLNVSKLKRKGLSLAKVRNRHELQHLKNIESGYGITQVFKDSLEFIGPVTESGYGSGTFYGDYAHHFWYGSYRERDISVDRQSPEILELEAQRLIEDYWNNDINYGSTKRTNTME